MKYEVNSQFIWIIFLEEYELFILHRDINTLQVNFLHSYPYETCFYLSLTNPNLKKYPIYQLVIFCLERILLSYSSKIILVNVKIFHTIPKTSFMIWPKYSFGQSRVNKYFYRRKTYYEVQVVYDKEAFLWTMGRPLHKLQHAHLLLHDWLHI